jgi:hypothetical protein
MDGTPAGAVFGALGPQNLILSCQTKAIYQSADGGASWQQTAAGPTATTAPATTGTPIALKANAIAASPAESVILATTRGIQVQPAGSSSWHAAKLNGTAPAAGFSFVGMTTPTRGIALPADPQDGTVWFTTDGGLSWTPSQVQGPNQ